MRPLAAALALLALACSGGDAREVAEPPAAVPAGPAPVIAPPSTPVPPVEPSGLSVGDTGGGSTPCHDDDECVLVTGGCSAAIGAHQDDAAEVDASHQALLSIGECAGGPTTPTRATCRDRRCLAEPLDHPEWRGCDRDRDCTAEWRDCVRWEAVARTSAEAAHAAWTGPVCPSIVPAMPEARCAYRACALAWSGSL